MNQRNQIYSIKRQAMAFGLLLVLVLLIYGNTFKASWHLDDMPNITLNEKLHISEISHDALLGSFFASPAPHKRSQLFHNG